MMSPAAPAVTPPGRAWCAGTLAGKIKGGLSIAWRRERERERERERVREREGGREIGPHVYPILHFLGCLNSIRNSRLIF